MITIYHTLVLRSRSANTVHPGKRAFLALSPYTTAELAFEARGTSCP
jgi:hypothetical protein